ncbi:MAG: LysM peptidoglycan-binding domain-containing protein [Collinsella sp.]|nr:LysM peptidoglycan-binding domain-containing protein [Collinsella sp.]
MAQQEMTRGNLAVALEQQTPAFTVISGGRTSTTAPIAPSGHSVSSERPSSVLRGAAAFCLTALILLVAASWFFSGTTAFAAAVDGTELQDIRVSSGDSLWSLAEKHPVEGLSTQETVDAMMIWNDLEIGGLQPGQHLFVAAS